MEKITEQKIVAQINDIRDLVIEIKDKLTEQENEIKEIKEMLIDINRGIS